MTIKFRAKVAGTNVTTDSTLSPFNFPAGEAHIKVSETRHPEQYDYELADIRGYSPNDLFTLAMWADYLERESPDMKRVLFLPYLPGARADRGAPFGAWVYADFINGLFIDQIITLDPHSPVAPPLYQNGEQRTPTNLTIFPFERIIKREIQSEDEKDLRAKVYAGVIAPDHGAVDRASRAAKVMGVPVYLAGKTRDFNTGQLTGFHMEDELPAEGKFLIVDDICDGGGTFNGLAEAVKKTNPDVQLDLWVTHGVFSKGFSELHTNFETIHTTNSYYPGQEYAPAFVKVHDIVAYLTGEINV